jgi:predicted nucleotidyltransferase
MKLLERNIDDIARLCRLYKVSKLFVFGSVLRETFNDESDIDLIVNFEQVPLEEYADNYFNLKFELESIFNRSVDLLEEEAIKNPYFKKEVDREKQLIYG